MLRLTLATLLVPDYDEAIAFYVGTVGFTLVHDTPLGPDVRWVVVAPQPGAAGLLLARPGDEAQAGRVGDQTGGRVAFFLETDDFDATYARWVAAGVSFCEEPRSEPFGRVVVWADPWGNRWDLIEPATVAG